MAFDIRLLTDEEIKSKSIDYVDNYDDYDLSYKRPRAIAHGLYDPKVFGLPEKCACGSDTPIGGTCSICRTKVMTNSQYTEQISYYKLHFPYVKESRIDALSKLLVLYFGKSAFPNKLKDPTDFWSLMTNIKYIKSKEEALGTVLKSKEGDLYDVTFTELPSPTEQHWVPKMDTNGISSEEINKILGANVSIDEDFFKSDEREDMYVKYDDCAGLFGIMQLADFNTESGVPLEDIKRLLNYNLVIPSPALRRARKEIDAQGKPKLKISSLGIAYRAIIDADKQAQRTANEKFNDLVDRMTLYCLVNQIIISVESTNALVAPSKVSMGRNLPDTRASKSFRSLIVAAHREMKMDEILLPRVYAYEAVTYDIIKWISERYPDGSIDPEYEFKNHTEIAEEAFQDVIAHSICVCTRNPSLHRFSAMAFHPKIWDEVAIGHSIAVGNAQNADYDGDTIPVWIFTDPVQVAELEYMTPKYLWKYDKNSKPTFNYRYETVYGLYQATKVVDDSDGKYDSYTGNLMDMYKAWKNRTLGTEITKSMFRHVNADPKFDPMILNRRCYINGKFSTLGRQILSAILGQDTSDGYVDIDIILGKDNPIKSDNVYKIVLAMESHEKRVDIYTEFEMIAGTCAHLQGLGTVPYTEFFNKEEIDGLKNKIEELKKSKEYTPGEIRDIINQDFEKIINEKYTSMDDCNPIENLEASGKVSVKKMLTVYAPTLKVTDDNIELHEDSLFKGLTEESFLDSAIQNRGTLAMKADLVPVSGFSCRQYIDAAMNYVLDEKATSKDEIGALLPPKDCVGRYTLDGQKITSVPQKPTRVKSCATSPDSFTVCGDEIALEKFNLMDGAAIGCAFMGALGESATQGGLGFKHGGALINPEAFFIKAMEDGIVTFISEDRKIITVQGVHSYTYKLSAKTNLIKGIELNSSVVSGQNIAKLSYMVGADNDYSKANLSLDCSTMDQLGTKYVNPSAKMKKVKAKHMSYAVCDGVISYHDGLIFVGTVGHGIMDPDVAYFFPEGYEVTAGTCISSGVPDFKLMSNYCDLGMLFYIYQDYLRNNIVFMMGYNIELFELLFKATRANGFSVEKTNKGKNNFYDNIYYGGAKSHLAKEITKAIINNNKAKIAEYTKQAQVLNAGAKKYNQEEWLEVIKSIKIPKYWEGVGQVITTWFANAVAAGERSVRFETNPFGWDAESVKSIYKGLFTSSSFGRGGKADANYNAYVLPTLVSFGPDKFTFLISETKEDTGSIEVKGTYKEPKFSFGNNILLDVIMATKKD